MKYFLLIILFISIGSLFFIKFPKSQDKTWEIQSIDTMKSSRDVAREKSKDLSFDEMIDQQATDIEKTGATHIAIATPYDEEFVPFLKRWVYAARKHHLKVWFRGNWSGWEGWFDYPSVDRQTHIAKTESFILKHKDLFEDGDLFSSCPECENGGPKVQFSNEQEVISYRDFLTSEYEATKRAFKKINKKVASNYYSMNGDVAKAVMDEETTRKLDGLVVVDHYVKSPAVLADNLIALARQSGGKVFLGEFGAPIPDINGNMSDAQQKEWLDQTMLNLSQIPELKGVSYWTGRDSSTALWRTDGSAKPALAVLKEYFTKNQ